MATTKIIKGGTGWLDSIYCSLFGWFFSPSSCRSSSKMLNDVKNATFSYAGGKKRKNNTKKARR